MDRFCTPPDKVFPDPYLFVVTTNKILPKKL